NAVQGSCTDCVRAPRVDRDRVYVAAAIRVEPDAGSAPVEPPVAALEDAGFQRAHVEGRRRLRIDRQNRDILDPREGFVPVQTCVDGAPTCTTVCALGDARVIAVSSAHIKGRWESGIDDDVEDPRGVLAESAIDGKPGSAAADALV